MNDDLLAEVFLLPREVVVVLDVEHHLGPEICGDMAMDKCVVCGRIFPHEFHGCPVFKPLRAVEGEPGKAREFFGKFRMQLRCELAVVVAHGGSGSPTATVRKKRDIGSCGKTA